MKLVEVIKAADPLEAAAKCQEMFDFYPAKVIEVAGDEGGKRSFVCIRSVNFSVTWKPQE